MLHGAAKVYRESSSEDERDAEWDLRAPPLAKTLACLIEMQCEYQSLSPNTFSYIRLRCGITQPHGRQAISISNQYRGAQYSNHTQGLVTEKSLGQDRAAQQLFADSDETCSPIGWKLPVLPGNMRSCRCRFKVSFLFHTQSDTSYKLDLSAWMDPPEMRRKETSRLVRSLKGESTEPRVKRRLNFSTPRDISPLAEDLSKLDLEERAGPVRWYEYSGPTAWPP